MCFFRGSGNLHFLKKGIGNWQTFRGFGNRQQGAGIDGWESGLKRRGNLGNWVLLGTLIQLINWHIDERGGN